MYEWRIYYFTDKYDVASTDTYGMIQITIIGNNVLDYMLLGIVDL